MDITCRKCLRFEVKTRTLNEKHLERQQEWEGEIIYKCEWGKSDVIDILEQTDGEKGTFRYI